MAEPFQQAATAGSNLMTDQPRTTDNLYHLILGLPEEVTSPNYYELLGLETRTSDSQAIKNAAADQNRKLLSWQNSDRYAEVRQLTFEVVQARDTLLNPESRNTYDASLGDWGIGEEGPWIVAEPVSPPRKTGPVSVRCPECEAEFKLRNRDLIGRRIPCPECGFRFRVRPEEPETAIPVAEPILEEWDSDAELKTLDNFDDMEDLPASKREPRSKSRRDSDRDVIEVKTLVEDEEYRDYESITPNRRRPRTPERGRNRTGPPPPPPHSPARRLRFSWSSKWVVLGGAGLMTIGLLALVVAFFQNRVVSPGFANPDRLAYLPERCTAVVYYRLGDVARSPSFQNHLTRDIPLRSMVDQFRDQMGMELQDIDSMTIGTKAEHLIRFRTTTASNRLPSGLPFVAVVRSSKDWDRAKLIGNGTRSSTHNGMTYHTFSSDDRTSENWAFYLADARTLLFGSVAEVQAAMETGGRSPNWPDAEFLQQEYAIIAAQLPDRASQSAYRPRPSGRTVTINGIRAEELGTGLLMNGNQIHSVSFLSCNSSAEASNFIALSEQRLPQPRSGPFSSNRGPTRDEFEQHGRIVAMIRHDQSRIFGFANGVSLFAPLEMLLRLGSRPAQVADGANPQPIATASQSPPANPGTQNSPPNVSKLDGLIADLRDKNRANYAAIELARVTPDPKRRTEVTDALQTMIETGGFSEQFNAFRTLEVWGNSDNVPFLVNFLHDDDSNTKTQALKLLGRWKDPRALPVVVDSLENIQTRFPAKEALKLYGAEAEPELLRVLSKLTKEDWDFQYAICDVLKDLGTRRSLPQLDALAYSSDGNASVKFRARSASETIRKENR